jgi:DNA polymerase sigma
MPNATTTKDVAGRNQPEPRRELKRLTLKDSVSNGSQEGTSEPKSSPSVPVSGRTCSTRNIIAETLNQKRQSEQSSKPTSENFVSEKRQSKDDDTTKRQPLSYDKMISDQSINDYINPYLRQLGLDDARNYIELSSDCFVKTSEGFYFCVLCFTRGRDEQHCVERHLDTPKHVDMFLNLRSILLNITPSPKSINMIALRHLMKTWYDENALISNRSQLLARQAAIDDFCTIVEEIDPQCQCRVIGSVSTGTSLVDSDINLELLHPNDKLFQKDPRAKNSIHHKLIDPDAEYGFQINNHTLHYDLISNAVDTLHKIATFIKLGYLPVKSFQLNSRNFCTDLNAKVPKLVLIHEPTNVKLEIWCQAEASHQMACLLKTYLSLDPRVEPLSILVKYWAKICRISTPGRGTLTPDTFIILVIHFLQRVEPPVLPCLHEIFGRDDERAQKPDDTTTENSIKFEDAHRQNSDGNDDLTKTSKLDPDSLDNNMAEDEFEEDVEDEPPDHNFDQEAIDELNWKSKNPDPVHKLFVDFLKFSISEFANTSMVISIRSLKNITVDVKKWNTQVKPIENPIRPSVNLSRNIGSMRTYDYIKQCFRHGYYYLTSIPMLEGFKPPAEPKSDPTGYVRLYFNMERFDFYFHMKKPKIKAKSKGDCVGEMIQQNLFARDVAVIKELIEYSILNQRVFDTIPPTVARYYDTRFLIPPDAAATNFCWLCRCFGHAKAHCPKRTLIHISRSVIDPTIDEQINFDEEFLEIYANDMIQIETAQRHQQIIRELTDIISTGTGLDCILQLFGSTVNMLGSHDSDLDVCMTLRDNPTGRGVNCVRILKRTCEVLKENEHVDKDTIEAVLAARVPIIKFKYDNFDVDLSMYNQCAIHNSKLLRTYVTIDERVPQLCYLVKQYAKSCGIADASRGSLSSYAWSLMVIHFLQHTKPAILPVLQETANWRQKPTFGVNGWNVWFNEEFDRTSLDYNDANLTSLFKEFLLYYSEFDFSQYVVSIRTSRSITKFQKNWTYCMMAIEDPFELTYNLSGRLDDAMALYIMNSFPKTYIHFSSFQKRCRRLFKEPGADDVRKLFNGRAIMGCEPPYRGCRICHRIGHRVKECPEKTLRPKKPRYPINAFRQ